MSSIILLDFTFSFDCQKFIRKQKKKKKAFCLYFKTKLIFDEEREKQSNTNALREKLPTVDLVIG